MENVGEVRPVAHESTLDDGLTLEMSSRNGMASRKRDDTIPISSEKRITAHPKRPLFGNLLLDRSLSCGP
jgi:hypothetical protein